MAHSLSRKKSITQNQKHNARNTTRKSELRTLVRKLTDAIHDRDFDRADGHFKIVTKRIDQIASTSTMHKNTAARKKSRLAKMLNAAKAAS